MNSLSIVPILVFVATILLVFRHPIVRVPFTKRHVHVDYGLAPLLGVLFLIAIGVVDAGTIARGILGSNMVSPYAIIALVITLAYICISLDYTGLFEYISLRFARAAKGSGKKAFHIFFHLKQLSHAGDGQRYSYLDDDPDHILHQPARKD
ncbi:MAG: hypothetical protein ABH852_04165 [Methanobacteriota archaeon]